MDGVKEDTEKTNIEQFMNTQNEMNKDIVAFMEKYAEDKATRDQQQSATLTLLQKLIEKNVEPPAKKARSDLVEATPGSSLQSTEPAEATPGSVTGKEKKPRSDEAILGSTQCDSVTFHINDIQTYTASCVLLFCEKAFQFLVIWLILPNWQRCLTFQKV